MYLIIEEDLSTTITETITEAVQDAIDEGIVSVIDMDNHTELNQEGEWIPLDSCDWA